MIAGLGGIDLTPYGAANNNVATMFTATGPAPTGGIVYEDAGVDAVPSLIVVGEAYMITASISFDWTTVGAPDNEIGSVFVATDVGGAGPGLARQLVSIAPSDTAAMVPDVDYIIASVGGTDFTAIGAVSNTVGLSFTATGPGVGLGQVRYPTGTLVGVGNVYGTYDPVPYTADEIGQLQFSQSADVIFITHPNHPQATLSRYSDYDWRYEIPQFDYGPYLDQQIGDQDISLSVVGVVDRVRLTSTAPDFSAATAGSYVEYAYRGQKVLGLVTVQVNAYAVIVEPLEDRSLVLSKEVYSPGLYTGWDGTNSVPLYDATITGTGVAVAFSATAVVTQEHVGNFLRFCNRSGEYFWMSVTGVEDILRQGAYGIIANGDILEVIRPAGTVTRSARTINAKLKSSDTNFFNLSTDYGRLFRLVIGEYVVHARGREGLSTTEGLTNDGSDLLLLSTTFGLAIGDFITGPGIPADTQILSLVDGPPQSYAVLSNAATATTAEITAFTVNANSTAEINVFLNRSIPRSVEGLTVVQNGTTNDWNRGAWFTGNYPNTVCFHEGRLGFAGTTLQPQTGWLSKVDDLYNFATTDEKLRVYDDAAINFTIASDTINQIQWMCSRQVLLIGTAGAEWKISSSQQGSPLTPTNISVQNQSSYGSAFVKPISIGKSALYLQRAGRKLREMSYEFQTDSQISLDLTVFAEHILKTHGGAEQLCYQQLPESVIFARLADGQIAVLTYEPDQKVYAWSRFVLGGPDAFVESIATVAESDKHRLYMVVSRTINGSLVRTIEVLDPEFRPATATTKTDMLFMDNATIGGSGTAALFGLNDFKGCAVAVLIDDTVVEGLTVAADGTLTLPSTPTTRYVIGFAFTSVLKTFPVETQAQAGTGQGKIKRIDRFSLRLLDSIGFQQGPSLTELRSETTGSSTTMFSGDVRVSFANGFDTRGSIYVTQSKAYPLAILSVMPELAQYQ